MPTTTRRPHTKSRHGCRRCKQNRTKCDEKRPTCGRCARTGSECSLLDPSSALIIIERSSPKSKSTVPDEGYYSPPASKTPSVIACSENERRPFIRACDSIQNSNGFADLEHERLRLMNQYHRATWPTIASLSLDNEPGRSIWRDLIPDLAFKHEFLLHGLLSVTALHIALTDPSLKAKYSILAVKHHNMGIALYSPHLSHITADNADALFAFAALTALYSFGIHINSGLHVSSLAKIHEVFTMVQGTSFIVQNGIQWLERGIWAPWFEEWCASTSQKLPTEVETMLSVLKDRISTTITTSTQSEMYAAAIEALRKNFVACQSQPYSQSALVTLPVCAPLNFSQMICIGEPLALCILANWAVIIHWLRRHIWLRDWGAETVKAVDSVLPSEWQPCIAWAMQEVRD